MPNSNLTQHLRELSFKKVLSEHLPEAPPYPDFLRNTLFRHRAPQDAARYQEMLETKLGVARPLQKLTGRHPEQQGDEVFLGNFSAESLPSCGWRTKRVGFYSYDRDGMFIPGGQLLPVFAKTAELEAAGVRVAGDKVF